MEIHLFTFDQLQGHASSSRAIKYDTWVDNGADLTNGLFRAFQTTEEKGSYEISRHSRQARLDDIPSARSCSSGFSLSPKI